MMDVFFNHSLVPIDSHQIKLTFQLIEQFLNVMLSYKILPFTF